MLRSYLSLVLIKLITMFVLWKIWLNLQIRRWCINLQLLVYLLIRRWRINLQLLVFIWIDSYHIRKKQTSILIIIRLIQKIKILQIITFAIFKMLKLFRFRWLCMHIEIIQPKRRFISSLLIINQFIFLYVELFFSIFKFFLYSLYSAIEFLIIFHLIEPIQCEKCICFSTFDDQFVHISCLQNQRLVCQSYWLKLTVPISLA